MDDDLFGNSYEAHIKYAHMDYIQFDALWEAQRCRRAPLARHLARHTLCNMDNDQGAIV